MSKFSDENILDKLKAGEARLQVLSNEYDALMNELDVFRQDDWVQGLPYPHLVQDGILGDLNDRLNQTRIALQGVAAATWLYRVEAKRRGLV